MNVNHSCRKESMFVNPQDLIIFSQNYVASCGTSVLDDMKTITLAGTGKLTAIETANNIDWLTMRNSVISRVKESERLKVTVTEIILGNLLRAGLTVAGTPILKLSASELLAGGYLTKLGIEHLQEMFDHEAHCKAYLEGLLGETESEGVDLPSFQSGTAVRRLIMNMLAFCLENILAGKAITPNNLEILVGSLLSNIGLVSFQVPAIKFFALNPGVSAGIVTYVTFVGVTAGINGAIGVSHLIANYVPAIEFVHSINHLVIDGVTQSIIMLGCTMIGYLIQNRVFKNTIIVNKKAYEIQINENLDPSLNPELEPSLNS
jgi:predicted tellurium resistance membrane protein TerC